MTMGRPSNYTDELADQICERIASGNSLSAVLRGEGMPGYSTVMRWLGEHQSFRDNYARAMEWRADGKFDELDEVSEEACRAETPVEVAGLKLKADNIKWQLARMNAKKYGDKTQAEISGPGGSAIPVSVSVSFVAPKVGDN